MKGVCVCACVCVSVCVGVGMRVAAGHTPEACALLLYPNVWWTLFMHQLTCLGTLVGSEQHQGKAGIRVKHL